jgi:hypothetical protein
LESKVLKMQNRLAGTFETAGAAHNCRIPAKKNLPQPFLMAAIAPTIIKVTEHFLLNNKRHQIGEQLRVYGENG